MRHIPVQEDDSSSGFLSISSLLLLSSSSSCLCLHSRILRLPSESQLHSGNNSTWLSSVTVTVPVWLAAVLSCSSLLSWFSSSLLCCSRSLLSSCSCSCSLASSCILSCVQFQSHSTSSSSCSSSGSITATSESSQAGGLQSSSWLMLSPPWCLPLLHASLSQYRLPDPHWPM